MIDRFTGDAGKTNLIDALLQQKIVAGDRAVAEKIAASGELVPFEAGETIIEQDGDDDDVFFIINGEINIIVNDQHLKTRQRGTVVGEMAAIDSTARRSATVKSASDVMTFKLSAENFKSAGESSVKFWQNLTQLVAERLRERSRFHLAPNPSPIMFMGSSVEGLEIAQEIQAGLKHDPMIVRLWTTNGVFRPSEYSMEDLMQQVDTADFALFVFGPDDKISCREEEHLVPRDNVILEMGLFVGRLGRERVFMVQDADVDLKIPTDLLGINPITYKSKPGCSVADVVGTVCTDVRREVKSKGVVTHRIRV